MTSIRDKFLQTVKSGDLDQTKKILAEDKDLIHCTDRDELTPLHHAAWHGHEKVVEYLLSQSTQNLNSESYKGMTPLLCAASYGYPKVIKLLLQSGADVKKAQWTGQSALHYIAKEIYAGDDQDKVDLNLECMALLLAKGANVNQQNTVGETPLMSAKNIQIFKALLDAKPNLEIKDNSGNTVFLDVCKTLNSQKIRLLIDAKVDINAVNTAQKSALDLMIESSENVSDLKKNIQFLLQTDHPKFSPVLIERAFQKALTEKNTTILQLFLSLGLKLPASKSRLTLLNHAYSANVFDEVWAMLPKDEAKAEEEVLDDKGNSLLIRAISDKKSEIAKKLVPFSNVTTVNLKGETALSLAAAMKQVDLMTLLLDHGASPNELDRKGTPILVRHMHNDAIATLLIQKGADLNYVSLEEGNTLLIEAILRYQEAIVKLILEKNPGIIHHKNKVNRDALFVAVFHAIDRQNVEKSINIVKYLLEAGANPFVKCTGGHSFLATAYELSGYDYRFKALFAPYAKIWDKEQKLKDAPPEEQYGRMVAVSIAKSPHATFKSLTLAVEEKPIDKPVITSGITQPGK